MEYGIRETFTEEEYTIIQLALRQYFENADKLEEEAVEVDKIENAKYWHNDSIVARKAYYKVLYSQEKMPW